MSHSILVGESAFAMATSCVILPSMKSLKSACSKVCEPGDMLFSSASLISPSSPFSISSAMWRVLSSTSTAATRIPVLVRTSRCQVEEQRCAVLQRIEVDDAVHRVIAVVRVQRREAQVSGLRVRERHRHGGLVADLNAVGRLAQRILERGLERLGVGADLALVHDRLAALENELDRVFERQDVARHAAVAVVEERSKRSRFAGAGGA